MDYHLHRDHTVYRSKCPCYLANRMTLWYESGYVVSKLILSANISFDTHSHVLQYICIYTYVYIIYICAGPITKCCEIVEILSSLTSFVGRRTSNPSSFPPVVSGQWNLSHLSALCRLYHCHFSNLREWKILANYKFPFNAPKKRECACRQKKIPHYISTINHAIFYLTSFQTFFFYFVLWTFVLNSSLNPFWILFEFLFEILFEFIF